MIDSVSPLELHLKIRTGNVSAISLKTIARSHDANVDLLNPTWIAESNFAGTLAGRSFRTLVASAARLDLELIQYDAVNVFVIATFDQDVFMRMPPGHRKTNTLLKLNKAPYGLRRSPLLWWKELSEKVKPMGFSSITHEPCCFIPNGVIIFFHVGIVIAHRKRQKDEGLESDHRTQKQMQADGWDSIAMVPTSRSRI